MEENTTLPVEQADLTAKKERSAAHPAISIDEAIKVVSEIHKNFRYNYAKRNDILDLVESAQVRSLAAATYYSLLDREKDSYKVSESYKKIANPIDEKEKQIALIGAFSKPTLYQELIEKFDGAEVPKELIVHLSRFHRITEDAAPNAAEAFIKSAKYCGVLDINNKLVFKEAALKISSPNFDPNTILDNSEVSTTENQNKEVKEDDSNKVVPVAIHQPPQLLLTEMVNEEKVRVRLTENKFAYIIHPLNLTLKDLSILRKQLDVIEELIT